MSSVSLRFHLLDKTKTGSIKDLIWYIGLCNPNFKISYPKNNLLKKYHSCWFIHRSVVGESKWSLTVTDEKYILDLFVIHYEIEKATLSVEKDTLSLSPLYNKIENAFKVFTSR